MKRFIPALITICLSLMLALFSAALTYSAPSDRQVNFSAGTFFMQVTPTPQLKDKSEVGSTDKIVVMGGVISFIVIVPILMMRKSWR